MASTTVPTVPVRFRSAMIFSRTAELDGLDLTVFQGVEVIGRVRVLPDATEGELWDMIHAFVPESAGGVSLAKPSNRDIPGVVQYQVSEWEADRRRTANNPRVDGLGQRMEDSLYANDPAALREAFGILAR